MSNDYLQQEVDREGDFRVFPVEWSLVASPKEGSQSICIEVKYAILEQWDADTGAWNAWPAGYYVEGGHWIIGKEGAYLDATGKRLSDAKIWFGDFDQVSAGPPPSVKCLVSVESKEFNNNTSYVVNWLNADAAAPRASGGSGMKPVDTGVLAQLRTRYSAKARSVAGGSPGGQPGAPPAAAPPIAGAVASPPQAQQPQVVQPQVVQPQVAQTAPPIVPPQPGSLPVSMDGIQPDAGGPGF